MYIKKVMVELMVQFSSNNYKESNGYIYKTFEVLEIS